MDWTGLGPADVSIAGRALFAMRLASKLIAQIATFNGK